MLNPVYCRQLDDKSGFGVFQWKVGWSIGRMTYVVDEKWELCLGIGDSEDKAWQDYKHRVAASV